MFQFDVLHTRGSSHGGSRMAMVGSAKKHHIALQKQSLIGKLKTSDVEGD